MSTVGQHPPGRTRQRLAPSADVDRAPKPKIVHVFSVRDRPVGFQSSRWGGALVAVERGYFPVSSTGFWSLSCGVQTENGAISPAYLESLAAKQDREREALLKQLREVVKPVGDPIANYIHVSLAYEKAVQEGFFAPDRDRIALWAGAHQLLCLVDTDKRFQPSPDPAYPAWTKEQCAASLDYARSLRELLPRLAAGDFPKKLPVRLSGAHAYVELPPKPGGESKFELGGFTAAMALNLPTQSMAPRRSRRSESGTTPPSTQLGLFDASVVIAAPAKPTSGASPQV